MPHTKAAGKLVRAVPERRMGTSEARSSFSKLVKALGAHDTPSGSLLDNAIEVGPQRKGGVWLIPEVDGRAALERIEVLTSTVEELEDELENVAIGFLLAERVEHSRGDVISGAQLMRDLGYAGLAEGLPE
jgi:hypothetical protein